MTLKLQVRMRIPDTNFCSTEKKNGSMGHKRHYFNEIWSWKYFFEEWDFSSAINNLLLRWQMLINTTIVSDGSKTKTVEQDAWASVSQGQVKIK